MNNQPPQHILDKINSRGFSTYKLLSLIRETPELDIETDNGWSWLTWNGLQIEGSGDERFTSQSDIDDLLYMAIGDGFKDDIKRANNQLTGKILQWYAKSRDPEFMQYFDIKVVRDGHITNDQE